MLNNRVSVIIRSVCNEAVIVPTAFHGTETSSMRNPEKIILNVPDKKCTRSFQGVTGMDRVKNEEVRIRTGIERKLASKVDRSIE